MRDFTGYATNTRSRTQSADAEYMLLERDRSITTSRNVLGRLGLAIHGATPHNPGNPDSFIRSGADRAIYAATARQRWCPSAR